MFNRLFVPKAGFRKPIKWLLIPFLLLFVWWLFCLPATLFNKPPATVLLDGQGNLLSATIAADGQWRIPAADSLSARLTTAILTFEDKRFYQHWGIDFKSLLRAARQNWEAGKIVSGGSTISMQVIRLARDNPPRTIGQKLLEIFLATRLEWRYSKAEILRLWCEHAPFGGNVVGVEAAAWRYYGRSALEISWAEAATLAVLPNSPGLIHPGRARNALEHKRNRLLQKLLELGEIDSVSYELARLEALPMAPRALPRDAPHLLQRIRKESGAGRKKTTINGRLQRAVSEVVENHREQQASNQIHNAAALVIEVSTGKTIVYVGNGNPAKQHAPDVDMITAPRSPGSLLKPILYSLALSKGTITPEQLLPDYPSSFRGFRPANFSDRYSGAVMADRALTRSLNIPFVYLLRDYGIPNFHADLQQLGFAYLNQPAGHYGLSLILGGCEISMEQIANFYLGLARQQNQYYPRQGQYNPTEDWKPTYYQEKPPKVATPNQQDPGLIDAGAGYTLFQTLRQLERPDESGAWERFPSSRTVAWKTGTSFGFRDAWAVGTTPEYVVAVWMGNASGEGREGLVGIKTAAPLLFDIFDQLPYSNNWFEQPFDAMREMKVCTQSGQLAAPYCSATTNWLPKNAERAPACSFHQQLLLNEQLTERVRLNCHAGKISRSNWFELPSLMAHYYRKEHPNYQPSPPWSAACAAQSVHLDDRSMQLIYPYGNGAISLSEDNQGNSLPVVFKLAHRYPETKVFWHLDGEYLTTTIHFHNHEFTPEPGMHQLVVSDENGRQLTHNFRVE